MTSFHPFYSQPVRRHRVLTGFSIKCRLRHAPAVSLESRAQAWALPLKPSVRELRRTGRCFGVVGR